MPGSLLSMQVKIVLRDRESGRYFRSPLEWVTNPYEALTFQNILEAEEFCREQLVHHVQYIQQSGYFPKPLRYSPAPEKGDFESRNLPSPSGA
jgi:hypothetical protein